MSKSKVSKDQAFHIDPSKNLKIKLRWKGTRSYVLGIVMCGKNGSKGYHIAGFSGSFQNNLTGWPFVSVEQTEKYEGSWRIREAQIASMNKFTEVSIIVIDIQSILSGNFGSFFRDKLECQISVGSSNHILKYSDKTPNECAYIAHINTKMMSVECTHKSNSISLNDIKRINGAQWLTSPQRVFLYNNSVKELPSGSIYVYCKWQANINIDLHCFYKIKKSTSFIQKILKNTGHVSFLNQGKLSRKPYIELDLEESLFRTSNQKFQCLNINNVQRFEEVLIALNVFEKPNANFGSYNLEFFILSSASFFHFKINSSDRGPWRRIFTIKKNTDGKAYLHVLEETSRDMPTFS